MSTDKFLKIFLMTILKPQHSLTYMRHLSMEKREEGT